MKSQLLIKTAALAGVLSLSAATQAHELCKGFAPQNNRQIPIKPANLFANQMTEATFNKILDRVSATYTPVITAMNAKFRIDRRWTDNTANAYATRSGNTYVITMFGGLARHPLMTEDGFMLVACHETGHHIGGAPKKGGSWASNEGQADYFGNLQCMKNILGADDNISLMKAQNVDAQVVSECAKMHETAEDQALCQRISLAGHVLGDVLADLGGSKATSFGTPDKSRVTETDDNHPEAQCRLDTYYNAALCNVSSTAKLSDNDADVGTCSLKAGFSLGTRPLCWFAPDSNAAPAAPLSNLAEIHY
ncbi:MAG: hypothetical protein JST16_10190 [Bdellovibrionales bacterium]|nr:hypothetical protein [Bdellovibrionales bacterium]